ncbi:hypothetical protein [Pseudoxanthomonas putridarboris]|uniref:PsiF repeat-containing protein n=1 Tax=Pseudoxanthomonas putridarboris TaxID=752605 RepID=A0ABU9J1K1_9GAMM
MKSLVMLALAACLATAAHAQTPAEPAPAPQPQVADAQVQAGIEDAAKAEKKSLADENCVRKTGTRIAQRDGKQRCTSLPGRSYSKEDLDRTGHTNLADALRTLDPSIR